MIFVVIARRGFCWLGEMGDVFVDGGGARGRIISMLGRGEIISPFLSWSRKAGGASVDVEG
ncbi:hypothetical protein Csa_004605 [Cucumis sativus]|nr:hypothetical protein Csa_004605 [Cucumis sativus]